MKKYIPYFAVFFVILLIVITIEENNDQPSETSAGTLIGAGAAAVIGGIIGSGNSTHQAVSPTLPAIYDPAPPEVPPAIIEPLAPGAFDSPETEAEPANGSDYGDTPVNIQFEPTLPAPDPANLIVNGYFLDEFTEWKRELTDEGGSSKAAIVESNNSPFNRALQIQQRGLGNISFSQLVPVNSINLTFSVTFESTATEGVIWGFSGTGYAAIILDYYDYYMQSLGYTMLATINESPFAGGPAVGAPDKIADTNTERYIRIESDQVQKNYTLNLASEITENLLGINPADVCYVKITLAAGSNDKDAEGTLTVSDLVLKYYL